LVNSEQGWVILSQQLPLGKILNMGSQKSVSTEYSSYLKLRDAYHEHISLAFWRSYTLSQNVFDRTDIHKLLEFYKHSLLSTNPALQKQAQAFAEEYLKRWEKAIFRRYFSSFLKGKDVKEIDLKGKDEDTIANIALAKALSKVIPEIEELDNLLLEDSATYYNDITDDKIGEILDNNPWTIKRQKDIIEMRDGVIQRYFDSWVRNLEGKYLLKTSDKSSFIKREINEFSKLISLDNTDKNWEYLAERAGEPREEIEKMFQIRHKLYLFKEPDITTSDSEIFLYGKMLSVINYIEYLKKILPKYETDQKKTNLAEAPGRYIKIKRAQSDESLQPGRTRTILQWNGKKETLFNIFHHIIDTPYANSDAPAILADAGEIDDLLNQTFLDSDGIMFSNGLKTKPQPIDKKLSLTCPINAIADIFYIMSTTKTRQNVPFLPENKTALSNFIMDNFLDKNQSEILINTVRVYFNENYTRRPKDNSRQKINISKFLSQD